MNAIIRQVQDYLKGELYTPRGTSLTPDKPVRTVQASPPMWVNSHFNSLSFPGVFVWGVGEQYRPGLSEDTVDGTYRVQIQSVMESTDKELTLFNENYGIFNLVDRVQNLLADNKRLDYPNEGRAATGMESSWDVRDSQILIKNTFAAIARTISVSYVREGIPWRWKQQNETKNRSSDLLNDFGVNFD